jgi:penicillin-binding protein 2
MDRYSGRGKIIIGVFILMSLGLLIKAAHLQLIDKSYRIKAESTTIGSKVLYPARGLFLDRNGKILVNNEPVYDLLMTYDKLKQDMDTSRLCKLLDINKEEFIARMDKDFSSVRYARSVPFTFYSKIETQDFLPLQEVMFDYPGMDYIVRNRRYYPSPNGAHILGYLSEVDQKKIDASSGVYSLGDYIGATGLEARYEEQLRGNKGVSYVLRDNLGRVVEPLHGGSLDTSAISGSDIAISIDINLQAYGEELMQNKRGAIVVIEPSTGEILTSVSSPTYDPNTLSIGRNRGTAFNQLMKDTLNPLLNRALMSRYPPGSLIKPIWTLIALQEGIINERTYINCNGGYTYHKTTWNCHGGGGVRGVVSALQFSCNTFYYITYRNLLEVAGFRKPEVGLEIVNEYMADFGLGQVLGVDIGGENPGFIPSPEFYRELYKSEGGRWYSTYTISNGIGQGEFELTTLQMANLVAILANKGYYYTPHFVKYMDGRITDRVPGIEKKVVPIDEKHFDIVQKGMEMAVKRGTATAAYIPGINVCGKTGTSQNSGEDHSVFFAFAPKENPRIAIAVYIENAGWGSSFAAPIASLMIEKYINGSISPSRKWLEARMINAQINGL